MCSNECGTSSDKREDDGGGTSSAVARPIAVEESNCNEKEAEQVGEDGKAAMEGKASSFGQAVTLGMARQRSAVTIFSFP